jgi:uncharacterized OB-fold protein
MGSQTPEFINAPKTMIQFISNLRNGILSYVECDCGHRTFQASIVCPKCHQNAEKTARWKIIETEGKIITYTAVFVGPPQLADITPYLLAIVNFGTNLQIAALINIKLDPNNLPSDLIGKKVKPEILIRPEGPILSVKLVE